MFLITDAFIIHVSHHAFPYYLPNIHNCANICIYIYNIHYSDIYFFVEMGRLHIITKKLYLITASHVYALRNWDEGYQFLCYIYIYIYICVCVCIHTHTYIYITEKLANEPLVCAYSFWKFRITFTFYMCPRQRCDDTCQIWKWYSMSSHWFYRSRKTVKITEWGISLVTFTPWLELICIPAWIKANIFTSSDVSLDAHKTILF